VLHLKPTRRFGSIHKVVASSKKSLVPQNYFNHDTSCYIFWLTCLNPGNNNNNNNLYFSTVSPTSVSPTNQISLYPSQFPNKQHPAHNLTQFVLKTFFLSSFYLCLVLQSFLVYSDVLTKMLYALLASLMPCLPVSTSCYMITCNT
jgi:hypothetical protein